jgi:FkbM family methyltransferase
MRKLSKVNCYYKYVGCEESEPVMKIDFKRMISPYKAKAEPYRIDVIKLDEEYHPADRTLIKVDVEGGEIDVLKGARELCKLKRVHWTIDVHSWIGVSMKQVKNFFDPNRNFNETKNRLIVR